MHVVRLDVGAEADLRSKALERDPLRRRARLRQTFGSAARRAGARRRGGGMAAVALRARRRARTAAGGDAGAALTAAAAAAGGAAAAPSEGRAGPVAGAAPSGEVLEAIRRLEVGAASAAARAAARAKAVDDRIGGVLEDLGTLREQLFAAEERQTAAEASVERVQRRAAAALESAEASQRDSARLAETVGRAQAQQLARAQHLARVEGVLEDSRQQFLRRMAELETRCDAAGRASRDIAEAEERMAARIDAARAEAAQSGRAAEACRQTVRNELRNAREETAVLAYELKRSKAAQREALVAANRDAARRDALRFSPPERPASGRAAASGRASTGRAPAGTRPQRPRPTVGLDFCSSEDLEALRAEQSAARGRPTPGPEEASPPGPGPGPEAAASAPGVPGCAARGRPVRGVRSAGGGGLPAVPEDGGGRGAGEDDRAAAQRALRTRGKARVSMRELMGGGAARRRRPRAGKRRTKKKVLVAGPA
jgi:hypothetical protein